nr:RNA-directed DNA polymerase, eukaryota [Tanacetum cinerariifolium]
MGNGVDTSFWEDVWRGNSTLKPLYPRVYALETSKNIIVAEKISHVDLGFSLRRNPRGGIEQVQFTDLSSLEDINIVDMRDRWFWSLEGTGDFSVASVRRRIDDLRLQVVSSKTRWVNSVPIKINIHAWKVRNDDLPTRLNISKRGMDIASISCPICGLAVESVSHIFFACQFAREFFYKVCNWWDITFTELSCYEDWSVWLLNIRLHSKHKKLIEGVCYSMWWEIWNFRNKSNFGPSIPSKASLFEDMVSRSFYWARYRCKTSFSWIDWLKNLHLVSL